MDRETQRRLLTERMTNIGFIAGSIAGIATAIATGDNSIGEIMEKTADYGIFMAGLAYCLSNCAEFIADAVSHVRGYDKI